MGRGKLKLPSLKSNFKSKAPTDEYDLIDSPLRNVNYSVSVAKEVDRFKDALRAKVN